jgi:hypothetical protein
MAVKRSQSPLVGSKKRRYQQQRPGRSGTFRRFRSSFSGSRCTPPAVGNGPYRKDGGAQGNAGLPRLSRSAMLAGLLTMLLALLGWQGYHLLEHAQVFFVRKVTVQGCRMAAEKQVLALAGIRAGMPMLGFTAAEAAQRIQTHPWIDHVSIHRSWPYSVRIEVQEHRPLALINLEDGGGLHYLDHNGKVFAPVEPGQDLDFPVVTGLRLPHLPADMQEAGEEAADAVRFLHFAALGNPVLPMQSLSEIHISRENGIIAYLAERPFPIHIGYGNIRTRYYQLVRLLEQLYGKEKIEHIKEIRMDYQADRILVSKTEP